MENKESLSNRSEINEENKLESLFYITNNIYTFSYRHNFYTSQ